MGISFYTLKIHSKRERESVSILYQATIEQELSASGDTKIIKVKETIAEIDLSDIIKVEQ